MVKRWRMKKTELTILLYSRSAAEVAKAIGASPSAVAKWRRGEKLPSAQRIRPLARYLKVPERELSDIIITIKQERKK